MTWDAIQQVIRILLYTVGGYFFGDAIANGELYQAFIAGVINIGAFGWWFVYQRNKPATA